MKNVSHTYITFNMNKTTERIEVVKPLSVRGDKTLIAYVDKGGVATKWVSSSRIFQA